MAGQGSSWMLQVYLLMLLVHPLDPSSRPERDTGTWGLLPEELELQDLDPEDAPWVDLALVSWTCFLGELFMGIVLACCIGRRLWRRWRECCVLSVPFHRRGDTASAALAGELQPAWNGEPECPSRVCTNGECGGPLREDENS